MTRTNRKGFTLIEILIVVIILGILAAIVIPQFTNASKEAKQSSLVTQVQSLRSQIALYKLQHNDNLPGAIGATGTLVSGDPAKIGDPAAADSFWGQMTLFSDVTGKTYATKALAGTEPVYGPYMQSVAVNPLTNGSLVMNGTATTAGADFIYDYAGGLGSGKLWGTSDRAAGTLVVQ
jgi:general secretion pathway protein G